MTSEETIEKLKLLGLSEQKAKETIKNAKVTKLLLAALSEVDIKNIPIGAGSLLYHLATKIKPQIESRLPLVCKYVANGKLDSTLRVDAALEYLLSHINEEKINVSEFENYCGIGVTVSPEQVEKAVENQMERYKQELKEKRYRFNAGLIMQAVRAELKWADGKAIQNEVAVQILDLLGPKTEADLAPAPKPEKKSKSGDGNKKNKVESQGL